MYDGGGKKNLNLLILEVLKDYSDEEHALTQQRVLQLLKENYGVVCDRRSVRNNIDCLIECGFDIDTEKGYRLMSRTFDDAELQMLINSVVFSKFLTKAQAKQLIDKLVDESSRHFKPRFTHLANITTLQHTENKQAMINLDLIDEAIEQNILERLQGPSMEHWFGTDGQGRDLFARVIHGARISLGLGLACTALSALLGLILGSICGYFGGVIDNVEQILDEERKPAREVKGMEHGLDLPKHMAEHVYMFSGESVTVLLRTSQRSMDMLYDWFGKDFQIVEQYEDGMMDVRLRCNQEAMEYWALQYGKYVTVLEPAELREKLRTDIAAMAARYEDATGDV